MISAHVNVADLLCCAVQENFTMVLELMYSNDERRVAHSTSKQIWDILYKDTVAPDVMQTEGGEDDIPERENPLDEDDSHHNMHSIDSGHLMGMTVCMRPHQEGERWGMTKGVPRTRWLGIPVW